MTTLVSQGARAALISCGLVVAATLAGCAAPGEGPKTALALLAAPAPAAAAEAAAPEAGPKAATSCDPVAEASFPPLSSLPKPGQLPAGSLERAIADRGYLVVGVSGDTRLMGARDALDGSRLKGFDIDIARAVARGIFGPADVDSHLRFKVITTAERIPLVNLGAGTASEPKAGVDLVARVMTMTCDRWTSTANSGPVMFSAVYYQANQRLLTRPSGRSANAEAFTLSELAAQKSSVCAAKGSTSLERMKATPGVTPVGVPIHSDCLALWQEGQVDAITGDDTILAGMADQDPRARIGEESLGQEPVGLATSNQHPEFVQFLNAVLASPDFHASWTAAYTSSGLSRWIKGKAQPAPNYNRPLPG